MHLLGKAGRGGTISWVIVNFNKGCQTQSFLSNRESKRPPVFFTYGGSTTLNNLKTSWLCWDHKYQVWQLRLETSWNPVWKNAIEVDEKRNACPIKIMVFRRLYCLRSSIQQTTTELVGICLKCFGPCFRKLQHRIRIYLVILYLGTHMYLVILHLGTRMYLAVSHLEIFTYFLLASFPGFPCQGGEEPGTFYHAHDVKGRHDLIMWGWPKLRKCPRMFKHKRF